MKLVNLSPHAVVLLDKDGVPVNVPVHQPVPRVATDRVIEGTLATEQGAFTVTRTFQRPVVQDAPPACNGVCYIVSRLVVDALPDRDDLYFPDDLVRDDRGQVIGARSLGRLRKS